MLVYLAMKLRTRRRRFKIATHVSNITMGELNKDCSDIDYFDEDIAASDGFVTSQG